jgi:putative hemolysin
MDVGAVTMDHGDRHFTVRLAQSPRDLRAAQRLRYAVFVEELGANGPLVDHDARLECDAFDAVFDHLLLIDTRRDADSLEDVVGVYRLLPGARLDAGGRFYSEGEFDLAPLRASGKALLELGRSCVHADYRGGSAMFHLWNALGDYVLRHGIDVMFGAASFAGTDVAALAQPLGYLHHVHLAPEGLRARAVGPHARPMNGFGAEGMDKRAALLAVPALIKAYLRLGGFVGEGAFVDHAFNTTDVLVVMDTGAMSARHRRYYERRYG